MLTSQKTLPQTTSSSSKTGTERSFKKIETVAGKKKRNSTLDSAAAVEAAQSPSDSYNGKTLQ